MRVMLVRNRVTSWISPRLLATAAATLALATSSCVRSAPVPQPEGQLQPEPAVAAESAPTTPQVILPNPALARVQADGVAIADIAEAVLPSVVNVSSTRMRREQTPFHWFFGPQGRGGGPERREQGLGSGVIVSTDGVVLTNNHVVAEAEEITITTSNGKEYEAKVLGTDPKSDLAVLKMKGDVKGLSALAFGDSSHLRLGDVVLAIGNPFGIGQTVTMGIVSAKGRADVGIVDYEDFIQTDAAINPGNSGGALVNMRGELVGINTAILSRSGGYQGIGFAIPSNMALNIVQRLLDGGGVVKRGFLGVFLREMDQNMASRRRGWSRDPGPPPPAARPPSS
jgi:S1-C subfamily serine protease